MIRYLVGWTLVFLSFSFVAVAVSALTTSDVSLGLFLAQLVFALLCLFQGREYILGYRRVSVIPATLPDAVEANSKPDFDVDKFHILVEKLRGLSSPKLIPIAEYFDGNFSDQEAIGANLWPEHPGIEAFRCCFEALLRREDVVSIAAQVEEPDPDSEEWPYCYRVFVYGDITEDVLRSTTKVLQPSEVERIRVTKKALGRYSQLWDSHPVCGIWWD